MYGVIILIFGLCDGFGFGGMFVDLFVFVVIGFDGCV